MVAHRAIAIGRLLLLATSVGAETPRSFDIFLRGSGRRLQIPATTKAPDEDNPLVPACHSGYVDVTAGKAYLRSCAAHCEGGPSYATGSCRCACLSPEQIEALYSEPANSSTAIPLEVLATSTESPDSTTERTGRTTTQVPEGLIDPVPLRNVIVVMVSLLLVCAGLGCVLVFAIKRGYFLRAAATWGDSPMSTIDMSIHQPAERSPARAAHGASSPTKGQRQQEHHLSSSSEHQASHKHFDQRLSHQARTSSKASASSRISHESHASRESHTRTTRGINATSQCPEEIPRKVRSVSPENVKIRDARDQISHLDTRTPSKPGATGAKAPLNAEPVHIVVQSPDLIESTHPRGDREEKEGKDHGSYGSGKPHSEEERATPTIVGSFRSASSLRASRVHPYTPPGH